MPASGSAGAPEAPRARSARLPGHPRPHGPRCLRAELQRAGTEPARTEEPRVSKKPTPNCICFLIFGSMLAVYPPVVSCLESAGALSVSLVLSLLVP